jgi:hypothetical protein
MTLQSLDAQLYVRRLRYYDRRGEDPERVAGLARAITFDMEEGPQDYFQGRGVRLASRSPIDGWLSLLDDPDRLGRVSKLTIRLKRLSPAESQLHARVLADAQAHA